jgi:endonuclease/exonuclease/phosphatase family metal-dependent hydrolase
MRQANRFWSTLAAFVCAVMASTVAAEPLRVMSFNIRGDFDLEQATDGPEAWNALTKEHRRDLVATTIREFKPDILGVQEAFVHQLKDLETGLGDYKFYGVGRDDGKLAGETCAIFYRKDRFLCVKDGTFWLSETPDKPGSLFPGTDYVRIASWALVADHKNDDREFLVINTHWDHISQAAREHGAKLIRERIASLAGGRPVQVMGDLNDSEDSASVKALIAADSTSLPLIDSYRAAVPSRAPLEATYHGFEGSQAGSRIDFILPSRDFEVNEAAIDHRIFDRRYPSDHFPVTAVLEFAEGSDADTKGRR